MDHKGHDFYANFIQITTGLYDVIMQFKLQTLIPIEQDQDPEFRFEELCSVRMSPQHAKSVAALLVKHVLDYEEENGLELPVPPNIKEIWDKHCK